MSAVESTSHRRFLSTPSARRATRGMRRCCCPTGDFYPRPPRGGRPAASGLYKTTVDISIHALREEGDHWNKDTRRYTEYFYPRPPRGGRLCLQGNSLLAKSFLSTPSARRATGFINIAVHDLLISIHALREEGDLRRKNTPVGGLISIHALREEGDEPFIVQITANSLFLSTPSARRATGARREVWRQYIFLSTPSARRATRPQRSPITRRAISIHALREEGDLDKAAASVSESAFLSTPSARRATYECFKRRIKPNVFLSTPSARRATSTSWTAPRF